MTDQGIDCSTSNDPSCANKSLLGTTQAATTTELVQDGTSEAATQVLTGYGSPTSYAEGLATSVVTNADGIVRTTVYTPLSTIVSPTGTLPVFTEPPEIVQANSRGNNNGGMSKGATAGIAIATCIIGAAIAFAITYLLFKRRDRKFIQKMCPSGYPVYADSSPELAMVQKSAAAGSPYVQVSHAQMRTPIPVPARVPAPIQQSGDGDVLAGIIPPSANQSEVQHRVLVLFGQIHRHVDTYYRDVHASITPSMDSDLVSFGKDMNMLELLQNCSSPTVVLKHALIAFVLGITEDGNQTLWPRELAYICEPSRSDSAQLAAAQALHRRISVFLYTQANALTSTNRSQTRLSNLSVLSLSRKTSSAIREAAEHFSLAFFPWADPSFGDQERESDLAGIIGGFLECRIWLCGQAYEWGFEWEDPGRGSVVVAPSLVVREESKGPIKVVLGPEYAKY